MQKFVLVGAVLGLMTVGSHGSGASEVVERLKEDQLTLKYDATSGEAAIQVDVECEEALARVELWSPSGVPLYRLSGVPALSAALSGTEFETQEAPLAELLAVFPAGEYTLRARTTGGQALIAPVTLSHALPRAPVIVYPAEGALEVSAANLSVSWSDDPNVANYRVSLEQGESDGISVTLPPGSKSFTVPDGVLARDVRTRLELAAIAADGNVTSVEIQFRTR